MADSVSRFGKRKTDSDPALAALKRTSAEIAQDPLLIQGAGGNTSLKQDEILWVKASGCWLEDAEDKPIFVPVCLFKVRDNIVDRQADCCLDARLPDEASAALRPSIETALHAAMPHAAVIHAHAVNCTTTALLADGQVRFERAMNRDLHGIYLPYATPGLPLANALCKAIAGNDPPDIVLLQNHGVVIGAECPDAAASLLREVENRLEFLPQRFAEPDRLSLAAHESTHYEALPFGSEMALDPYLFSTMATCALTPDQIVFLGGPVCTIRHDDDIELAALRIEGERAMTPALVLREGVGAFQRRDCSAGTKAVIAWLARIAVRIPKGADILSLPIREVANLLGWDAEQYRLKLDRNRQAGN